MKFWESNHQSVQEGDMQFIALFKSYIYINFILSFTPTKVITYTKNNPNRVLLLEVSLII